MTEIFHHDLAEAEARGRNGWFRAAHVSVRAGDGPTPVTIDVSSRKGYGDLPPIVLNLSREDAEALRHLLHQAIAALPGAVRYRTACPACGAALRVRLTAEAEGIPLREGGYDDFEAEDYRVVDLEVYCLGAREHTFPLFELELSQEPTGAAP